MKSLLKQIIVNIGVVFEILPNFKVEWLINKLNLRGE